MMVDACHSPSFLKKITELSMRALTLPTSFVKVHGKLLKSDVILEGPSRKQWKVVVEGSSPSLNVITFGHGWEDFVIAHVLQLGDQLCFTLTGNSLFQVEVYDESGCQKTSALDASGSELRNSLVPESYWNATATRVSHTQNLGDLALDLQSVSMFTKEADEKVPTDTLLGSSGTSLQQIPRLSESGSTKKRFSHFSNLGDPTLSMERGSMYAKDLGERPLTNVQVGSTSSSLQLPRRQSALESIRRDSAREGSAMRDPYVLLPSGLDSAIHNNSRGLVPNSLSDLVDCFVDIEKILSEPPDLTDTQPLVIEDFPPCWELHGWYPPTSLYTANGVPANTTSLDTANRVSADPASLNTVKRISALFSNRPPELQIPSEPTIENLDASGIAGRVSPQQSEQGTSKRSSIRTSAWQIPWTVSESEATTHVPMRLSQIQKLDDPTARAENLVLYTKETAEKALMELQLQSASSSPLAGFPLSNGESRSIFKPESYYI